MPNIYEEAAELDAQMELTFRDAKLHIERQFMAIAERHHRRQLAHASRQAPSL